MIYQFQGQAKLFNGRFWVTIPIRVKASGLASAIAKGIRDAIAARKPGTKVVGAQITLERLGRAPCPQGGSFEFPQ